MSTQVFLAGPSYRETYYAMGSARAQSPGPIGAIGLNGAWLINASDKLAGTPPVGSEVLSQLAAYHQERQSRYPHCTQYTSRDPKRSCSALEHPCAS